MALPYPNLTFDPLQTLPAESLNQLMANIAALAAGTGLNDKAVPGTALADTFMRLVFQSNTTNTNLDSLKVKSGWGYIVGTGTAGQQSKTVTFDAPFTNILFVLPASLGYKSTAGSPTAITQFDSQASPPFTPQASAITNTNFRMTIARGDNSSWSTNNYAGFSWIAIGT